MQERKVKAAMQICKPHEWEAHFIAENHELTKTKTKQTEKNTCTMESCALSTAGRKQTG